MEINEQALIIEQQAKQIEHLYKIIDNMREEIQATGALEGPPLPRGFARLSNRHPVFPFILANSKSLKSLEERPSWRWKWKSWFAWMAIQDRWELTLTDGRKFQLTEEEKEAYLRQLQNHDETVKWARIVDQTRNAYKAGVGS